MPVSLPSTLDELIVLLCSKPPIVFVPRLSDHEKDPLLYIRSIGLTLKQAKEIIYELLPEECACGKEGMPCDDLGIPAKRMWAFQHLHKLWDGRLANIYIKLAPAKPNNAPPSIEAIIQVIAVSFHSAN